MASCPAGADDSQYSAFLPFRIDDTKCAMGPRGEPRDSGARTLINLCGQRAECSVQGQRGGCWVVRGLWGGLGGALISPATADPPLATQHPTLIALTLHPARCTLISIHGSESSNDSTILGSFDSASVLGRLKAFAGFGQLAALRAVLRSLDPPCARWRWVGVFFQGGTQCSMFMRLLLNSSARCGLCLLKLSAVTVILGGSCAVLGKLPYSNWKSFFRCSFESLVNRAGRMPT